MLPIGLSAQSRYAPTLKRACLDRVNSTLELQLTSGKDTCTFVKHQLWGRTDVFNSFQLLDESSTFNILTWNVLLPDKKKWELYISSIFNCANSDTFLSNHVFIDDTPPSYIEPDSVSVEFATQRIIAGWSKPPDTDIMGYSLFRVDGVGNNNLVDEKDVLFYSFDIADFDPSKSGNRLAIAAYDSCRNGGVISDFHSPILASVVTDNNYLCNKGIRINWSPYIGWEVSNYTIYIFDKDQNRLLHSSVVSGAITNFDYQLPYLGLTLDVFVRATRLDRPMSSTSNRVSLFVSDFPAPSRKTSLYFASVSGDRQIDIEGFSEIGDSCTVFYQEGSNAWLLSRTFSSSLGQFRYTHALSDTRETEVKFLLVRYNSCGFSADSSLIISTLHLEGNDRMLDWNDNKQWRMLAGAEEYIIEKQSGSNWSEIGKTPNLFFELPEFGSYWVRVRGVTDLWSNTAIDYTISNPIYVDLGFDSSLYDTLLIPNAFSPDGNNPIFKISNPAISLGESTLSIYNRWGQKLWEGDALIGWDGRINGVFVTDGLYVYQVIALYRRKRVERSGTVLLLR